jgi:hypothetical protein
MLDAPTAALLVTALAMAMAPGAPPQTLVARGEFDVKIAPLEKGEGGVDRMHLVKTFRGALVGRGEGEMLAGGPVNEAARSGAYVAIERVEGALDGREGAFLLVHRGVMTRGAPNLSIEIVPDTGTGALEGISGRFLVDIRDGKHFYTLEYKLPPGE